MQVTEILEAEHRVILDVLTRLESLFTSARYGVNLDEISKYIRFFQEFADDFHHSKEEEIYFIWMKNKNPDLEHGPLMCMISEHEQGRILLRNAHACLDKFSSNNDANDLVEMKKNLVAFAQILKNHITKEDEILYPIAEELNLKCTDGDEIMLERFLHIKNNNTELLTKYKYLGV